MSVDYQNLLKIIIQRKGIKEQARGAIKVDRLRGGMQSKGLLDFFYCDYKPFT